MNLVITHPATVEPVTIAEALTHCRITHQRDNDYLAGLCAAAREYVETTTGVMTMAATIRQTMDRFPDDGIIQLWRSPLISVTSVKYTDDAGEEHTIGADRYVVDADGRPPRIAPCAEWALVGRRLNAIAVTFQAGHASAAAVPSTLKAAIKMLVAHWYEQRQPVVTGTISTDIPMTVQSLLRMNRVQGGYR